MPVFARFYVSDARTTERPRRALSERIIMTRRSQAAVRRKSFRVAARHRSYGKMRPVAPSPPAPLAA